MIKGGQALSVDYLKMTDFNCVAHAFHCMAEVIRGNYPKVDLLISSVKKSISQISQESRKNIFAWALFYFPGCVQSNSHAALLLSCET